MQLEDKSLEKIADLARLEFDDQEKRQLLVDINRMISFVEKLREVDTTGIEPLTNMTVMPVPMRTDRVSDELEIKDALRNAPDTDGVWFRAPKVIK